MGVMGGKRMTIQVMVVAPIPDPAKQIDGDMAYSYWLFPDDVDFNEWWVRTTQMQMVLEEYGGDISKGQWHVHKVISPPMERSFINAPL